MFYEFLEFFFESPGVIRIPDAKSLSRAVDSMRFIFAQRCSSAMDRFSRQERETEGCWHTANHTVTQRCLERDGG